MQLCKNSVENARKLIEAGKVKRDSEWSKAAPLIDDENAFLENRSWYEYAEWYLAEDEEESRTTNGRFNYPYGDLTAVHRSGLIAAKQRAAQYDHTDIEQAADELLNRVHEGQQGD